MASSIFAPAPEPPTRLGRHRQLSPTAGVHVSPIALGGLSIGDGSWDPLGPMNKEKSFELLDAFYKAGGNFIDTSNNYQDESSEKYIGEWMESRGVRDQIVVATKYSSNYRRKEPPEFGQKTHYTGNSIKSLHLSVEASLKKLRTDYIDILFVHWWDNVTSIEEVVNGLHNLVVQGKVLYLGISDTPAWIVSKANTYARLTGKTPFVAYQGLWSILQRDLEIEIIPMARAERMAIMPWSVLGSGKIRTDAEEEEKKKTGDGRLGTERTPDERKICQALEKVAGEVGAKKISSVAIAYVMQKTPYVFPIIGGSKVSQFQDNLEALEIALTNEQISYLDGVSPVQAVFPASIFGDGKTYHFMSNMGGRFDRWPDAEPIRPAKSQA